MPSYLYTPFRAREIVKLAAAKIEDHATKEWLRRDENGTWEKQAIDLLERCKSKAEKLNLTSDEVNDQCATYISLLAIEAMILHGNDR